MKQVLALSLIVVTGGTAFVMSRNADTRSAGPIVTHKIQRGEFVVTITEQGTLESSNNTEIKCRVRGDNIITSVVESGT